MAPPTPFHRILCLVICVSLAWFSVVAKPIELPALSQRQYMGNLSQIVDAVEGVSNEGTHSVAGHLPATFTKATPTCVDHDHCASGCMVTDAAPNNYTLTCSPPSQCSLDREGVGSTYSRYTYGGKTMKFNALPSTLTGTNVAPFVSVGMHEYSPVPYSVPAPVDTAQPAMTGASDPTILPPSLAPSPHPEEVVTFTARLSKGHNGEPDEPEITLSPENAPAPVPGQQTVYVTITEDSTTASPIPTAPFSTQPLSEGHPESNKTAIILGSVFGSLTILCILIVSVDHLLKLRRQKREELQEGQERHDSISSVEDMSELLRQQQQTYGYYGTQRVASSSIVPQQMKVFPASSEPVELPSAKDEMVEKERRDGH
ncbi:hypothetical protein INS49_014967 [Diaporthe citri]|uniref:uncharacterized protein n=1 Tax=Diaporthe citri TaxID=83186 RepID=UPI001C81765D|nr:uncharacterized protein INS49_014967 [Diaporthe citri]KAG6357090.1 hypothetical protein INS49_014967 [Diaporthe citri]